MKTTDNIIDNVNDEIKTAKISFEEEHIGSVYEVKDEVVFLKGLKNVKYGELIEFENNIRGLVIDLREELVGAIIFGDYLQIKENDIAKSTGKIFEIPVGEKFLGRVIDALGNPIDGEGKIEAEKYYPVERIAPGVVTRKSVSEPVQTGIKAIDALIPIGRGQRELIIGDRGTGKSTVAIDTIINQKDQNLICIYNVIGQRNSKIAALVGTLKKAGAMKYSVVVAASASDPASTQYIAPYSAVTLAEYFMDKGKDVLVIYDDLSKHAWAYRQISLILRRPSGREAYPGDIFYLHSKLLERSCRVGEKWGGGSITALPIIETQENDVSAYIPTNVISITDGQIFLESSLFNAGIRPAINVGISVSRVGGTAQTKAMKKVAGKLKIDLAQYRELAAFSQFEGELEESTKKFLDRGARMTQLLKQRNNHTMDLGTQVAVIWMASNGYLDKVAISDTSDAEAKFVEMLSVEGQEVVGEINKTKNLEKSTEEKLKKLSEQFIKINYELSPSKKEN
jgi:F-type H+-transporting ATPase subunit alpha